MASKLALLVATLAIFAAESPFSSGKGLRGLLIAVAITVVLGIIAAFLIAAVRSSG